MGGLAARLLAAAAWVAASLFLLACAYSSSRLQPSVSGHHGRALLQESDAQRAWTWDYRNILGLVANALNTLTAAATGQGGSQLLIPIFSNLLQFSINASSALSAFVQFLSAIPSLLYAVTSPHPLRPDLTLVDFPTLMVLMPTMLLGVQAGAILNAMSPEWLISFLLIAIYVWGSLELFRSLIRLRRKERERKRLLRSIAEDMQGLHAPAATAPTPQLPHAATDNGSAASGGAGVPSAFALAALRKLSDGPGQLAARSKASMTAVQDHLQQLLHIEQSIHLDEAATVGVNFLEHTVNAKLVKTLQRQVSMQGATSAELPQRIVSGAPPQRPLPRPSPRPSQALASGTLLPDVKEEPKEGTRAVYAERPAAGAAPPQRGDRPDSMTRLGRSKSSLASVGRSLSLSLPGSSRSGSSRGTLPSGLRRSSSAAVPQELRMSKEQVQATVSEIFSIMHHAGHRSHQAYKEGADGPATAGNEGGGGLRRRRTAAQEVAAAAPDVEVGDSGSGQAAGAGGGADAAGSSELPKPRLKERLAEWAARRRAIAHGWWARQPKLLLMALAMLLAFYIICSVLLHGILPGCNPAHWAVMALLVAVNLSAAVAVCLWLHRLRVDPTPPVMRSPLSRTVGRKAIARTLGDAAPPGGASPRTFASGSAAAVAAKDVAVVAAAADEDENCVAWTRARLVLWPPAMLVIGCLSGMLGMSGGVFLIPLLLNMNLHPSCVSATAKVLLFVTTGASSLVYALGGQLNMVYALVYGIMALLLTPPGQFVMDHYIQKTGAASILVLVNLARYLLGVGLLIAFDGVQGVKDLINGTNVGFSTASICS